MPSEIISLSDKLLEREAIKLCKHIWNYETTESIYCIPGHTRLKPGTPRIVVKELWDPQELRANTLGEYDERAAAGDPEYQREKCSYFGLESTRFSLYVMPIDCDEHLPFHSRMRQEAIEEGIIYRGPCFNSNFEQQIAEWFHRDEIVTVEHYDNGFALTPALSGQQLRPRLLPSQDRSRRR